MASRKSAPKKHAGAAKRTNGAGTRAANGGASPSRAAGDTAHQLWEVFTQPGGGKPHEHAGSVHAADAEMALQSARDVYARRGEAVNIWVVPASAITASTPDDMGPFFDPGNDKPYRHPQFYKVPQGVRGV